MNSLTWQEYVPLAFRTAKDLDQKAQWEHARLGIGGEVGELLDAYKKWTVYGKPFDKANWMEEIGDTAWYIALDQVTQEVAYNGTPSKLTTVTALDALIELQSEAADTWNSLHAVQNVLYLLTELAVHLDVTLGECLFMNIEKLARRYGDKYSDVAALHRNLEVERQVLERLTPTQEA